MHFGWAMSIYKRNDTGMWFVQVRRKGFPPLNRSFSKKSDATMWERNVLAEIDACRANPHQAFDYTKFTTVETPNFEVFEVGMNAEIVEFDERGNEIRRATEVRQDRPYPLWWAVERYISEEVQKFKSWKSMTDRLNMWKNSEFGQESLYDIMPEMLFRWMKNRRKKDGSPASASTVRNDLFQLSSLYETAGKPTTKGGWNITDLKNPVKDILLPPPPNARQRRLNRTEEHDLFSALSDSPRSQEIIPFIIIALATGMRKSEILETTVLEIVDGQQGYSIKKQDTKNGHPRLIHLSENSTASVIQLMQGKRPEDRIFSMSESDVSNEWTRARERAGCKDLRLHDIRHEAISRLADVGLSIGALASMSGHRTAQTLLKYVNASETDIREKLSKISKNQ
ncbi:integrase [Acetobacter aceti]|uniref:Integrase n=2 Tax=Acetobacter aceti TaxID=435 RepID=A0A6S6PNS7_ACEAC|nr:integrase [Acetobacter aceti]